MDDNTDSKFRYFAFIVYRKDKDGKVQIELTDLIEILIRSFGDFAISPLHQPDEDYNGEHWHVVYKHPSSVRLAPVIKFLSGIQCLPIYNDYVIPLHHPANYQRYLIHLDHPDKEQFVNGEKAISLVNNFPLNLMRELSLSDKMELQQQIESFACEYNIFEYASMTMYLSSHGMTEHYLYFTTHTHHFGKFLDSLRYSAEQRKEVDIDA